MIKLNKYNVTNGTHKARVWYSRCRLIDGRDCVTIYAKDYFSDLHRVLGAGVKNDSDSMTDYFEKSSFRVFPGDTLWDEACARAAR